MDHCPRVSVFLNYNLIRCQISDFSFVLLFNTFTVKKTPPRGNRNTQNPQLDQHGFFFFCLYLVGR